MITNSTLWLILVVAMGVPSAIVSLIVGLLTRRIVKKMDDLEEMNNEKEQLRIDHEIMLIEMSMVSLSLAEVTAEAVQRIPDSNCNGEMKEALSKAKEIKEKYREFERKQTVKTLLT